MSYKKTTTFWHTAFKGVANFNANFQMNGSLRTSLARETDTLMTTQIPFAYSLIFMAGAFKTIFISDDIDA